MNIDPIQLVLTSTVVSALVATSIDYFFKYRLESKLRKEEKRQEEFAKLFPLLEKVDILLKTLYGTPDTEYDLLNEHGEQVSTAYNQLGTQLHRCEVYAPKKKERIMDEIFTDCKKILRYIHIANKHTYNRGTDTKIKEKFLKLQSGYVKDIDTNSAKIIGNIKLILT